MACVFLGNIYMRDTQISKVIVLLNTWTKLQINNPVGTATVYRVQSHGEYTVTLGYYLMHYYLFIWWVAIFFY